MGEHYPTTTNGAYNDSYSTTHLGVMERLAILLNSECRNLFSERDGNMGETASMSSLPNHGQNNRGVSDSLKYFNNSTNDMQITSDTNTTSSFNSAHYDDTDFTSMAVEDILFQLANVLFLISYLAPPTRYGQVCLHSGLCIGFLIFATWAWNIVCAPDVFVWYFAFLIFNAGQLLYILYQVSFEIS